MGLVFGRFFNFEILDMYEVGIYKFKSLLIDLFRGPVVPAVRLQGLETVLSFTAVDKKIHVRGYKTALKKSGTKTPRVELEEIGPSLDVDLRRTRIGSDDLFKRAMKQPKAAQAKKIKNVSKDQFENKLGRVHLGVQDLSKLHLRKRKALKRTTEEKKRQRLENAQSQREGDHGSATVDDGVRDMET